LDNHVVQPHPIRLAVDDDRRRSRLTVFFRLLLALPHLVWFALWSIAALFAALASWFATLVRGRTPSALHRFLTAYVRYTTHVYAFLLLAANPFPGFTGAAGSYPVDVEIDGPARQSRWKTAFRLLLALPALVLAGFLLGGVVGGVGSPPPDPDAAETVLLAFPSGVAFVVAFFAWFVCLVRGRMPDGFGNFVAYALRYSAQTWGYVYLLTDRYPAADVNDPPQEVPRHPIRLRVDDGDLRRSRLTVFFRLLLALPHLVWVTLWGYVVHLLLFPWLWIVALVLGRMPDALHRFFARYLRYQAHTYAYLFVVANPFPGFTGAAGYPVDLEIDPAERQSRWKIGFRLLLAVPAFLLAYVVLGVLVLVSVYGWFVSLVLGRMPEGLRNLGAYVVRYWAQTTGYVYLLTDRYPYTGPALRERAAEPEPAVAPAA
jgi:hypothetical protein